MSDLDAPPPPVVWQAAAVYAPVEGEPPPPLPGWLVAGPVVLLGVAVGDVTRDGWAPRVVDDVRSDRTWGLVWAVTTAAAGPKRRVFGAWDVLVRPGRWPVPPLLDPDGGPGPLWRCVEAATPPTISLGKRSGGGGPGSRLVAVVGPDGAGVMCDGGRCGIPEPPGVLHAHLLVPVSMTVARRRRRRVPWDLRRMSWALNAAAQTWNDGVRQEGP